MGPVSVSPDWLRSRYRAALLLLAVIGAISIALALWLADAARWVSHSRDILRVARDANAQLLIGEAAIRGRLLATDSAFQHSDAPSSAAMSLALDSLDALTVDNEVQHRRAQAVVASVDRWWAEYVSPVLSIADSAVTTTVAAGIVSDGQALFAEAQARFSEFVSSEQQLYRRRTRLEYVVRISTAAATLAGLAILAVLFGRFERDLTRQSSALVSKSQALDQQLQASWDRIEALGVTKRRLEFLLESSPLATAIIDRDGIVEVANPAFHELASVPETAGTTLRQAVPQLHEQLAPLVTAALDDDSASVNQELITDLAAPDVPASHSTRAGHAIRAAPPLRKTWLVNVYPVRTEEGQTVGAGVVLADLTNERQLEAQYRQAQRLESLGRLTGGIAHDFNNILTVIVGFGEMAARGVADSIESGAPVDSHVAENLDQVQLAADRATTLTRQLLAYGRQQVLHPESLAIAAVVHEVETMLRRVIGEDVQLVTRLPDALWPVRVDRSQVEQILMNLAVNARDAMPEGGQLVIEARNVELDAEYARHHVGTIVGPHLLLAISDTGVGMDSATAARAFEPWFTTKPAGRGTGLGLATVYGIVKQSGGSIELYSELGHGTTFKIYLPRDASAPPLDIALPLESPRVATSRGARILLVEDDPAVALLAREVLASDGHTIVVAKSGREALQLFEADPSFDLVVTDVVMPELGGRALADELRRRGAPAKLLFMSGYAAEAVSQRTVLPPDAVFLEKPFRGAELLETVRRLLLQS